MNIKDYKLKISVGPDYENLIEINYNHEPVYINSDHFTGYLFVRVKDNEHEEIDYFVGKKRKYSMAVQGRFKQSHSGNNLMFGGDFDSPLDPPPGTSLAIRIAKWMDPAIIANGSDDKPYMFSPMLTAMNSLVVVKEDDAIFKEEYKNEIKEISTSPNKLSLPPWSFQSKAIGEDTELISPRRFLTYSVRKKYFNNSTHRANVEISPDHIYCMDFYDSFFDIRNAQVELPGFKISVLNFWNGKQKLRYSLTNNERSIVFFCVQYEYVPKQT